ncbi:MULTISPECIES: membrane protein insertase YidC [Corynebacterium]|uniref:Membrane protein insertase YidC n=1 Tax=Corynebacterium timonense TaxID=441500 RepID=A0A1H1UD55_9CORY|nr:MULTISPECIES: membrane protein insertase YidC [Corynebacterium]WJY69161.1 Membrane protein insertase YidC [Corynebacterium auris]SDS70415.1 YidC/Oxa1 family membrane protein insertase [Corynebacterium timonense]
MLNFVYWPISAVLWFWHKIFGFIFSPDSGISWILAIVFLTFTIRVLLVKPMVNQMRTMRRMQEMQPRMQEIRAKYKNDQQKMAQETQKLYKEMGANPLASCIVPIVQFPVFLGLLHVLRSFNRTGTGLGSLGMSVEENRNTANYVFSPEDVRSFLDADFFGVPLSAYMAMPESAFAAFTGLDFTRVNIIAVCLPLVIMSAVFTHLNARLSVTRQNERRASGKISAPTGDNAQMMETQMQMMNKMTLWIFPVMILASGFMWHIGLLMYMLANNVWTFFQTRIVFDKMGKEEAAEEEARREAKRASAPQVAARRVDKRSKRQRRKGS